MGSPNASLPAGAVADEASVSRAQADGENGIFQKDGLRLTLRAAYFLWRIADVSIVPGMLFVLKALYCGTFAESYLSLTSDQGFYRKLESQGLAWYIRNRFEKSTMPNRSIAFLRI